MPLYPATGGRGRRDLFCFRDACCLLRFFTPDSAVGDGGGVEEIGEGKGDWAGGVGRHLGRYPASSAAARTAGLLLIRRRRATRQCSGIRKNIVLVAGAMGVRLMNAACQASMSCGNDRVTFSGHLGSLAEGLRDHNVCGVASVKHKLINGATTRGANGETYRSARLSFVAAHIYVPPKQRGNFSRTRCGGGGNGSDVILAGGRGAIVAGDGVA